MATYSWFVQLETFNTRLLITVEKLTVVVVASGKGHAQTALINAGDSAHALSVKLSPCMCSHSSCPGWRNGCYLLAYVIPSYLW